jgi:hypothetical protein
MSWKAERTMSIVLAKHLIGVTQHPSTIIVRVVASLWHEGNWPDLSLGRTKAGPFPRLSPIVQG